MKNLVHTWHGDCRSLFHNETLAIITSNKERLLTSNSNRFSKHNLNLTKFWSVVTAINSKGNILLYVPGEKHGMLPCLLTHVPYSVTSQQVHTIGSFSYRQRENKTSLSWFLYFVSSVFKCILFFLNKAKNTTPLIYSQ